MSSFNFSKEVLSHRLPLKYYAISLTANKDDAKDLVQETMLKSFSNKKKFKPGTNLKAWLYTIMKNVFINNYRKRTKRNTIVDSTRDLYYINLPQTDLKDAHPEKSLQYKEIEHNISGLPDRFRIPFKMYIEGYKYKEISDSMHLPIGTIKSRIFLARKNLKTMV